MPNARAAYRGYIETTGNWLRYELHRHSNGSVGGYVHTSDELDESSRRGVVIYRDEAEMSDAVTSARGDVGVRVILVLDGEELETVGSGPSAR